MIQISKIEFQNLRGYETATLNLQSRYITIVGDNNQGKSSALLLLDFIFNQADESVLKGHRQLNDAECALLLPANDVLHQARRISLSVDFVDRRTKRRFLKPGEADVVLRLSVHKRDRKLRLNLGLPRRIENDDPKAFDLLQRLRSTIEFLLIPSDRMPQSDWFLQNFDAQLSSVFRGLMTHAGVGGAPREYRRITRALREVDNLAQEFGQGLWDDLNRNLPYSNLRTGKLNFSVNKDSVIPWLSSLARLRLSTGKHDARLVDVAHVGTGLQSLMGVALGLRRASQSRKNRRMICVEEPEQNLHPAAQRSVSVILRLLSSQLGNQVIVTTHSPYFLEEARYGETIIVRNRRYYQPKVVPRAREEINTAFMNVSSAEIFFANKAVFVEGPGDKSIFDTLLRRMRLMPEGHRLWSIAVRDVGGKTAFAPWVRLLRCYGERGDRPINWVMVFDGDAASSALTRCLQEIGYSVNANIGPQCQRLIATPLGNPAARMVEADRLNGHISPYRARIFSIDLDWAIVNSTGGKQVRLLALLNQILSEDGISPALNPLRMASKLGSKIGGGSGHKAPHLRFKFAQRVDFRDLPDEIESMLEGILKKFFSTRYVNELMAAARNKNPKLPY